MTIKETAGKMLLYFYQLQRTAPTSMAYRQLGFIYKASGGVSITSDKRWLTEDLLTINPISTDVFNAYIYLLDKKFIQSKDRGTEDKRIHVGTRVTSAGIDIVEGIEGGKEGRHDFTIAFNIPADHDKSVEELIKNNLRKLLEKP